MLRVPPKGIRSFTPEFWLDVFVMPSMSVSKLRELFPSFGFVMWRLLSSILLINEKVKSCSLSFYAETLYRVHDFPSDVQQIIPLKQTRNSPLQPHIASWTWNVQVRTSKSSSWQINPRRLILFDSHAIREWSFIRRRQQQHHFSINVCQFHPLGVVIPLLTRHVDGSLATTL